MPRRPRIILPYVVTHIIQRCNIRQVCFFYADDYRNYLDCLREYALEHGCAIHAYALMTNHLHHLLTPDTFEGPGRLMKRLGQRFVQYVNRTYRRSGTLRKGRYKSCLALGDRYVLQCYRYIELNPVRANVVEHPANYPWSSYWANAPSAQSFLISPHSFYNQLCNRPVQRMPRYRELFRSHLEPGVIDEIRSATNGNYVLGNKFMLRQVEKALVRRVVRGKHGGPSKRDEAESLEVDL